VSDRPLLISGPKPNPIARVEIARSFSFKVNRGNYESSDYFCSQKGECALEDAEDFSERLYQFCKAQVMKAVREDLQKQQKGAA